VYDRYLWALVLSGAVLLAAAFPVRPFWEWHAAASQAALAVVTAFALIAALLTVNSDAFDAARWRTARQEVAHGVPVTAVDAGFEWVGWHATAVADANASGDAARPYWVAMVHEGPVCVTLSASPLGGPGLTLDRVVTWRTWLAFGRSRLYEYRGPAVCPSVTASG
jgi:hypothetical protein